VCGDWLGIGPLGGFAEVEGVGFGIGRDGPRLGDCGDDWKIVVEDIVGDEPLIEESSGAEVVHPGHALGVEGVDLGGVDVGEVCSWEWFV